MVNNIFQFIKENNIILTAIYSSSLFNRFDDSLEYNFFLKEYSKELNKSIKKINFLYYSKFILFFEFIIFSCLYFINLSISKKIQNSKIISNEIHQNLIILEQQHEQILDFSLDIVNLNKLIPIEKTKFSTLLKELNSFNFISLYIEKIEINFPLIRLYGTTKTLKELYLFEIYLEENNFINLNNDYIKNTQGIYNFTIDMNKKEMIF